MVAAEITPTARVRYELSTTRISNESLRRVEFITSLRLAGGLQKISGRILFEADFYNPAIVQRIRVAAVDLYAVRPVVRQLPVSGDKFGEIPMFLLTIPNGDDFARKTGLLDSKHRRQVRGLPNRIVTGSESELAAALRGAFLARGKVTAPGHAAALDIICPTPEVAMALSGAANRLGVSARNRDVRGQSRFCVRENENIFAFLQKIGAPESAKIWSSERIERETRANVNRLVNFDDANLRRSAQASVIACARVERAFEILEHVGVPPQLADAGRLRLAHRAASLDELGAKADPPLTKDAVAGRIRRLLATADKVAAERGIEGTDRVVLKS